VLESRYYLTVIHGEIAKFDLRGTIVVRWTSPICNCCLSERAFAESNYAMNMIVSPPLAPDRSGTTTAAAQQGLVAIVSDDPATIERLAPVCEFLDLKIEVVSVGTELERVLREHRPMAIVTEVEGESQDGFHTMKQVARHSRDLPILLLTEGDAVLMGAVDAVQELWGLTSVTTTSEFPMAGQIVAFLFNAGRRAGCMRLIPV
jgi:CheY-like chemotaxis protein